jgi:hypothetical protein
MEKSELLREVIKTILQEEDYGGIGAGGYYGGYGGGSGGYGYGMGGWGGESVLSVFGTPFLDVFKTAAGSGKEVAKQAKGLVRTGIEASLSLVLPFVSGEYGKIAKETHEEVLKVKKEYEGVYKKNLDAFFNTDLVTLAFFLNPAAVVTGAAFDRFLYTAPDAAISALGWFIPVSGQKMWDRTLKALDPERLQRILKTASGRGESTRLIVWDDKNRRKLYSNVRRAMGIEADPNDRATESLSLKGVVILEDGSAGTTFQDVVKGIFHDPTIVDAMTSSEQAKRLKGVATKMISRRLGRVVDLVRKITSAPTPDSMGAPKLSEGDMPKVKQEVKERISKSLAAELEAMVKQGVDPKETGVQKMYDQAISNITNLPVNIGAPESNVSMQQQGDKDTHVQHGKEDGHDGTGTAGRAGRPQGAS